MTPCPASTKFTKISNSKASGGTSLLPQEGDTPRSIGVSEILTRNHSPQGSPSSRVQAMEVEYSCPTVMNRNIAAEDDEISPNEQLKTDCRGSTSQDPVHGSSSSMRGAVGEKRKMNDTIGFDAYGNEKKKKLGSSDYCDDATETNTSDQGPVAVARGPHIGAATIGSGPTTNGSKEGAGMSEVVMEGAGVNDSNALGTTDHQEDVPAAEWRNHAADVREGQHDGAYNSEHAADGNLRRPNLQSEDAARHRAMIMDVVNNVGSIHEDIDALAAEALEEANQMIEDINNEDILNRQAIFPWELNITLRLRDDADSFLEIQYLGFTVDYLHVVSNDVDDDERGIYMQIIGRAQERIIDFLIKVGGIGSGPNQEGFNPYFDMYFREVGNDF